jgi:16S rRNA (uracil1498-N3)-methyltransferase
LPAEGAPSFLWVPELADDAGAVELSREESHYLRHVCRARAGDHVVATDGRGARADLRVMSLGERVRAEVEHIEREARLRHAWLLCGAPEGQRADWLVEKLAELGLAVWQPLDCARGRWRATPAVLARWRRLAIAALRQSRRRFLMEVREPLALDECTPGLPAGGPRWIADPEGRRGVEPSAGEGCALGAVGPSSGFDEREKASFKNLGFQPMCLSDGRLRAETAALAWAAWWARGSP